MRPTRIGLIFLVAALVVIALTPDIGLADSVDAARIRHIEADLRPALQIRGRPIERHTLSQLMAAHRTPSISIAIVDHGSIVWSRAYGMADVAAKMPATVQTIYQAGSISKPVAASAALQLVQERRLALDESVNAELKSWHIPDSTFTDGHPVTLRELLTHTGGVSVHGFPGYAAGTPVPTLLEVLEGKPPANSRPVIVERQPGKVWNYSGGGFTIVQLLMIETDGQSFPELMRRRVLSRVSMTASTYEQPLPLNHGVDVATGYLLDGQPVKGRFHTYPEMAAAGLWTTPSDLARWTIALERAYNGEPSPLMSQASARDMLKPGLGGWGLGISVDRGTDEMKFGHSGDDWGFKARLIGWPKRERAIIAMGNSDDAFAVIDPLMQAVAREYGWKGLEPQTVTMFELNDEQRNELLGSWGHGAVKISAEGSKLIGQYQGQRFELIPQSPDSLITPSGDELRAVRGPDHKIAALSAGPWGRWERDDAGK